MAKSFDVFLGSGVNVKFEEDVNPDTDEGYARIKEAARQKFREMLVGGGFDVEIEVYDPA